MTLILLIKSGPLEGREFALSPGSILGRADVDISINDPKISGRHAKIEKIPTGDLILIDLGSTNGLIVANERMTRITLKPGLRIKIGNTLCEVTLPHEDKTLPPIDIPTIRQDEPPVLAKKSPAKKPKKPNWSEYLSTFSELAQKKVQDAPIEVLPLNPAIELSITRGIQSGQKWLIGYGPRNFGMDSLEFPLFEEPTLPLAFRVESDQMRARFVTSLPDKILLNGQSITSEILNDGDEITLPNTTIKVSYKE